MLFIASFFFTGCSLMNNDLSAAPPDVDYHRGTQGLMMSYLENMPPPSVYEGNEFEIWLELMNQGASDIRNGYITFSGFQSKYLSLEQRQFTFDLDGKSLYSPTGERTYIELSAQAQDVHDSLDSVEVPLTANSCYRYFTYFSGDLCLVSDQPTVLRQPSCTNENLVRVSGGQGSPLAVTGIDVEQIPSRTTTTYVFSVLIENVGDGKLRIPSAYQNDCIGPSLESTDIDAFRLEATIGNDEELTCTQRGNPRDTEGIFVLPSALNEAMADAEEERDHSISCRYTTENDFQSYKTKLNIRLEYGYTHTLSHQLTIKQYDR